MNLPAAFFAAAALLPAMTAPSEGTQQVSPMQTLVVALCAGGAMALPLGSGTPAAQPCCCAKGCRSQSRRRRPVRR